VLAEQGRIPWPCGDSDGDEEYGLALSGGGYRAMLFHLGSLWRLNELGMLPKLDRISTVSGGSLAAGFLALAWPRLEFDGADVAHNFRSAIAGPIWHFSRRPIDAFVIAAGLMPFVDPAALMARALDRLVTHGATLQDLPERPHFVINAAHLSTGTGWRFTKPYMVDYRLGVICEPRLPLAHAIAASAAFPPVVSPATVPTDPMSFQEIDGADLFDTEPGQILKRRLLLLDGGAYDNLGIETIEGRCRVALASDGGGNLKVSTARWRYALMSIQLKRTLDLAVEQGRAQRRRALVTTANLVRRLHDAGVPPERGDARMRTEHVALWRTTLDPNRSPKQLAGRPVHRAWPRYLSTLPTRMWPMSAQDGRRLVNWGYLTSDVMLRSWVPELEHREPPHALPFPDHGFASAPQEAV
jgi:NTE family protein